MKGNKRKTSAYNLSASGHPQHSLSAPPAPIRLPLNPLPITMPIRIHRWQVTLTWKPWASALRLTKALTHMLLSLTWAQVLIPINHFITTTTSNGIYKYIQYLDRVI